MAQHDLNVVIGKLATDFMLFLAVINKTTRLINRYFVR